MMHPAWKLLRFVPIICFSAWFLPFITTESCNRYWVDCEAYLQAGHTTSGVYHVYPQGMRTGYDVYCDMSTDGGGWLVFQRRIDGSVDFYRDWTSYERGFGNVSHEHWLGLVPLYRIQAKEEYELRVDIEDFEGNIAYATYNVFEISSSKDNFRLTVGLYEGNAGDSLSRQNGQMFSTWDKDNDVSSMSCAQAYSGAWWYERCTYSNLNGVYKHVQDNNGYFIYWFQWKNNFNSLKTVEMKIRRA